MPGVLEYLSFDEDEYRRKICRPLYSDQELEENIYKKRQKINGVAWTVGANLALVHVTAGLSAITASKCGRAWQIDSAKLKMLEYEWSRRGYLKLPKHKFRDAVIPAAISAAAGGIGMIIGADLAAAGSDAVNNAGISGGYALAGSYMHAHGNLPYGSGGQFVHGVSNGIQQTFGVLQHSMGAYAAPPMQSPAYMAGEAVGMNAVHTGLTYGVGKGGDFIQQRISHHRVSHPEMSNN